MVFKNFRQKSRSKRLRSRPLSIGGNGKTAELSPTLTSDGIYEGLDFLHIAAQAQKWAVLLLFGSRVTLWGDNWQPGELNRQRIREDIGINPVDIGGGAVICPNLDSNRSLSYLVRIPGGNIWKKRSPGNYAS
jgi:hypothetical protein